MLEETLKIALSYQETKSKGRYVEIKRAEKKFKWQIMKPNQSTITECIETSNWRIRKEELSEHFSG